VSGQTGGGILGFPGVVAEGEFEAAITEPFLAGSRLFYSATNRSAFSVPSPGIGYIQTSLVVNLFITLTEPMMFSELSTGDFGVINIETVSGQPGGITGNMLGAGLYNIFIPFIGLAGNRPGDQALQDLAGTYTLDLLPDCGTSDQLLAGGAAGGGAGDQFGVSVASSGDTLVVGALNETVSGADRGAAYVYVRSGSGWVQQARLLAADGAAGDAFGTSVAIDGNTIVVGAANDDVGASVDQGSAYIFVRSGTTWTQQAKLTANDGVAVDVFGVSVAVSGETAVVGAYVDDVGAVANQGSAYVFVRSGTNWTQQRKLLASNGAANDGFGVSVAIDGNTALVGAYIRDVPGGAGSDEGSTYVFVRSGTTWSEQAQLTALDSDLFGVSVALDGETAIIGSWADDIAANNAQGSAYVFTRSGTSWTQEARLTASDGMGEDRFGIAVGLSGNTAVVGAYLDDGPSLDRGAAYVFARSGTAWQQEWRLTAHNGVAGDNFGVAVALSGGTAVVGACLDDATGHDSGSAWTFELTTDGCLPGVSVQPQPAGACEGQTETFTVTASGSGPHAYQWRKDAVAINTAAHPSAATATLAVTVMEASAAGLYDCVVTNPFGSRISVAASLAVSSSDFDGDGDIGTDLDIEAFVACLGGSCCTTCGSADFDGDGDSGTDLDIEAFFRVLGGGSC